MISPYPIKKDLALVEAISRDLNEQLLQMLGNRQLMCMGYEDFEKVMSGAEEVFKTWEDCHECGGKLVERPDDIPEAINNRLDYFEKSVTPLIEDYKKKGLLIRIDEQLHQTILKVMTQPKKTPKKAIVDSEENALASKGDNDIDALEEIRLAYECVKDIDVLDVSFEGTEIWMHAGNAYNYRVSRIENEIISSLRDRLGTCKNANEMLRVFSKFNTLFVRPKVCLFIIYLFFIIIIIISIFEHTHTHSHAEKLSLICF